ncbi:hypothetical protein Q9L58_008940 [Maublancomyces gigas]|uniref:NodB homology domain-containing protein n=1 Tax=Discina gigas TaxID=1032678 RepID=A0ABR3G8P6_9PEZI
MSAGNILSSTTVTAGTPAPTITYRPRLGNIPYGVDINSCLTSGEIALTFDDGPWLYTSQLLDILRDKDVKATFFITYVKLSHHMESGFDLYLFSLVIINGRNSGNNLEKGAIDNPNQWSAIIARAYREGHQIASHTLVIPTPLLGALLVA